MNRRFYATLTVVVLLAATLPVLAQKKPRPPADILGTAWVDNDGATPCTPDATTRVHSDCLGIDGAYTTDGAGNYPKLNAERAMWLQIYGSRYVTLDFGGLLPGSENCATSCYRTFGTLVDTTVPRAGTDNWTASLHGNAIDADGNRLPDGLLSVPVGSSNPARFFINFPDPDGRRFHWSLWYSPTQYPGSDFATVTRTAQCTWVIEGSGHAQLVAHVGGKNPASLEGLFYMPFRVTFDAPDCGQ